MKLSQILAIEKDTRQRCSTILKEVHRRSNTPDAFGGFDRTYRPKNDEDTETLPSESRKVRHTTNESLDEVRAALTELWDVSATRDYSNLNAVSDVTVDGITVLEGAPTTFLLFMEKQLENLRTFVGSLPELDSAEDWERDEEAGLWKSRPVQTHRTRKQAKPIVLYEATEKHPAQTQMISEDVHVGFWTTVKNSGGISRTRKQTLLRRINRLRGAVKQAREAANTVEITDAKVAEKIFDFVLGD